MKYPLLVPVIGHGSTDLIDFPLKSILYNVMSLSLVQKLSYKVLALIQCLLIT